ncbi:hypothetical protein ACKWTF_012580 [Chironomus riparius]
MKTTLILYHYLTYISLNFLNCKSQGQARINVYKFDCPKDNETEYLENIVCKLDKNAQGMTLISTFVDILIPVKYAQIHINVIYQSDKSMVDNLFEYCSSYNNLPPYAFVLFGVLKQFAKDLIKPCPYKPMKRLGAANFPVDSLNAFFTIFNPHLGNYKTSIYIKDEKGKLITYLIFYSNISRRRPQQKVKLG